MNYGKTVIVGNGLKPRGRGLGEKIDSYDTVVRFSAFNLSGHETDLGTKTTVWVGYMVERSDISTFKQVIFQWIGEVDLQYRHNTIQSVCARHGVEFIRMPQTSINFAYDILAQRRNGIPKPTSGLVTICHFLLDETVTDLTIAGFDSYSIGHHFFDAGKPPPNLYAKHSPEKEQAVITSWIKSCELIQLD